MTEKEVTMEDLEETSLRSALLDIYMYMKKEMEQVKCTDQQLDLMEWKMDNMEKQLAEPVNNQEVCVMNLLKSVSEVRSDYQQLRRELMEVQALQRELSSRLRTQLRVVHGKFARLRQRIAAASPPR